MKVMCTLMFALLLQPTIVAAVDSERQHWRERIASLAQQNFKHPAWGFEHSVRDYDLARALARRDNVQLDDDVLFAAAYLHDVAMFAPWEKMGVDHADQGAAVVGSILRQNGFPNDKIMKVCLAIATHMFNRDPVGPESVYLHDADALDWLGAIGIARSLSMIDSNGGHPDVRDTVSVLEKYIKIIPPHIFSPAGKTLAIERNAEAVRYLSELRLESTKLDAL